MGKLTIAKINGLQKQGLYGDGGTLYLAISKWGGKHWVQRIVINGKLRCLGLGGWPVVSLEKARRRAFENRVDVSEGRDPYADKRKKAGMPSFQQAAEEYYTENLPRWKPGKHTDEWLQVLTRYAFPSFGRMPVDAIMRQDVLDVLHPIWTVKPKQAKRLRSNIRAVLQRCVALGLVASNVAGEVIQGALAPMANFKAHHRSLPYQEALAALRTLGSYHVEGPGKYCLQLILLTAVRSVEARTAEWADIDVDKKLWVIPAHKMKMKAEHRVPLSDAALKILEEVKAFDNGFGFVFPSPHYPRQPISNVALLKTLKGTGLAEHTVIHGFRTTFRTWAEEETSADYAVKEACLAHKVGSAVERAYNRSDLLTKRRRLMQQWADYVTGALSADVIPLHG